MNSEKLVTEKKTSLLEFFNIGEESGEERDRNSDMIFLLMELRREISHGIGDFFESYADDRDRPSKENGFEKKLFRLFLEYFFINNSIPLKEFMNDIERKIILGALSKVNGSQKEAAKILGVKHTTLNEKIKKYNIRFRKNSP